MAAPTVVANSNNGVAGSAPGSIYWESFTIQYQDQAFVIESGSTSLRWLWWRWNSGTGSTALIPGDVLPDDLTDDDLVVLSNKNGTPVRIQNADRIDGELLVDGTVFSDAIATEAIATRHLQSDSITAELLTADSALFEALRAEVISGISLEIQDAISARPGFLDIIAAQATAKYLTLRDGIITGTQDVFGSVRMLRGVSNPAAAPRATSTYPAALKLEKDTQYRGLCDNPAGTEWVSVDFTNRLLMRHSKATGAHVGSQVIAAGGNWYGVTRIGSFYYLLVIPSGSSGFLEYQIDKIDATTFARTAVTVSTGVYNTDPVKGHPAIGTDGTNILLSWAVSGGDTRVRRLNTSGALVDSTTCINGYAEETGGVTRGSHDVGSAHVWVATFLNNRPNLAWDQFGGRANTYDFQRATTRNIRGLWWDGTKMVTIASDGYIQEYSPGPTTQLLTVGNTWLSQDGTVQTALSPTLATTRKARSTLVISTDNPPETGTSDAKAANRVGLYAGPTAGPFRLQSALAVGVTSYSTTANYTTSGAVAPTVNGFAAISNNGRVVSEAESPAGSPVIDLGGDGSGRVGHVAWNPDGTNANDTDWVNATLASPWVAYGGGYSTPGYRVKDGIVYLRGMFEGGTTTTVFTLPVGARPESSKIFTGIASQQATGNASGHSHTFASSGIRINVSTAGAITITGLTGTWVSIDGIAFPVA